jgi:DNA invertase Pin-like site-specific DNA recombinase
LTPEIHSLLRPTPRGCIKYSLKRVALYLRSTKDRHDVSVEAQRRELTAHAESKSYVTSAVFEDKVQSAKTDKR